MLKFSFLPKKDLTINDLRVAILNYIVAKEKNDGFIIGVSDIAINLDGKEQESLDILKKFAIKEDILIYQSEKIKTYQEFAYKLLKENKAFACFCNQEELSKEEKYNNRCLHLSNKEIEQFKSKNKKFRIRIKAPKNPLIINDNLLGDIEFQENEIDSFVILDENGNPTYNFASAIDDMSMAIDTIITDKTQLNNSIKQKYIQNELGYSNSIEYIHLPLIENSNNYSIKRLLKEGFLPDAIINYLLTVSYKEEKEIFYLPDAIKWFDINKVDTSSILFDIDRLKELNRNHLQIMDSKKLSSIFGFADKEIGELLKLYLNNVSTINELEQIIKNIFEPKDCNKSKNIKILSQIIQKAPMIKSFQEFKIYLEQKSNLKDKDLEEPLKYLLTGENQGLELEKIYPLIKSYILEVARCH